MSKSPKSPPIAEATVLNLELIQNLSRSGVQWTAVASRPGRAGAFSRNWENAAGQLSAAQADDLALWCQNTVMSALVAWSGVQEVLET